MSIRSRQWCWRRSSRARRKQRIPRDVFPAGAKHIFRAPNLFFVPAVPYKKPARQRTLARGFMRQASFAVSSVALTAFACVSNMGQARAESAFPFGMEMTLITQPQPGSKRIPDLDIGDNGEVVLEL